jgi:hypothetical protein
MNDAITTLEQKIKDRQEYLGDIALTLARAGKIRRIVAACFKVMTIVLGAFAVTSATATKIFGEPSRIVLLTYPLVGLAIAAIGGLDAAFKYGERATELNRLAAKCEAVILEVDTQQSVAPLESDENAGSIANDGRSVLEKLDKCINDVRGNAAELGLHMTRFVQQSRKES